MSVTSTAGRGGSTGPTYARYERARDAVEPEPGTLRRLAAFWDSLGEIGPESMPDAPEPKPAPDLATALMAVAAEMCEWRLARQEMAGQIEELHAQVAELVLAAAYGAGRAAPAAPAAPRA